jgi:hypothetical protein
MNGEANKGAVEYAVRSAAGLAITHGVAIGALTMVARSYPFNIHRTAPFLWAMVWMWAVVPWGIFLFGIEVVSGIGLLYGVRAARVYLHAFSVIGAIAHGAFAVFMLLSGVGRSDVPGMLSGGLAFGCVWLAVRRPETTQGVALRRRERAERRYDGI